MSNKMESESRFPNFEVCNNWKEVTKAFDQLPKPALVQEAEGEAYREGWIYRGHKSETYPLKPSIERECQSRDWAIMEDMILKEFQKRAPLHMEPSRLPPPDSRLSWLAIMQHYGAPTRLLDFTESPYVALYFALRHRKRNEEPGDYAEVWGIDPSALMQRAREIFRELREQESIPPTRQESIPPPRFASADGPFISPLQDLQSIEDFEERWIRKALRPCQSSRDLFNRRGLIAVASPPAQNIRLSSQQGVFLFNGAEDHFFEESLEMMMRDCGPVPVPAGLVSIPKTTGDQWYKRFRIPQSALQEVEAQLFQMNIHDLSLFPDAEGLTGFLRQKLRLHLLVGS